MVTQERIQNINNNKVQEKKYVVYWMQATQRVEYNHALEYAIQKANKLNKPLLVVFGLTENYPEGNIRHYQFMLEGLREIQTTLRDRQIQLLIRVGDPTSTIPEIAKQACLVVTDKGYLKPETHWRQAIATKISSPLIQVESNVVVPIETASPKEEYTAGTFRPKITKHLDRFLQPVKPIKLKISSLNLHLEGIDLSDISRVLQELNINQSVPKTPHFLGGPVKAQKTLDLFIRKKLNSYAELGNDPTKDYTSRLSPYLHFGQISPINIALEVLKSDNQSVSEYLEQLIVRRELSMNLVHYNKHYDSLAPLPRWARESLDLHRSDPRDYLYTLDEFEQGKTHDSYWNACQQQMVQTGYMHGYMRMYWGKKILEWSKNPNLGYRIAITLNNKYELDGRDPNGFTGVLWCFGKHDRAWKERPIFGKVRYMNAAGLKRKFSIDTYVTKWQQNQKNN